MFVEEVFIAMDGYKKPTWKYLRRLLEQILDYPHLNLLKVPTYENILAILRLFYIRLTRPAKLESLYQAEENQE